MESATIVKWVFGEYTRDDLMKMEPVPLGALLRERTHHMIEVPLYPTLLKWKGKPIKGFGRESQMVFDVWREKGLPEDAPDIQWVKTYLAIAEKIRAGEKPVLKEPLPAPFTDEEMAAVHKLIYQRRSIRDWIDKEVPDEMIEKILEAGRAAPIGCNLGHLRFIVLKDPEERKMMRGDVPTRNATVIVICHDKRIPAVVGHDRVVPQNPGFDAAAAADHMLLMAHALGLGGVWLTKNEMTAKAFREQWNLPEHFEVDLFIAVGWTAIGSIKSARPPLDGMIIRRESE